jgi:hypothetical protein
MKPVTILIPAYKPQHLAQTLISVLAQSYVDTHLVIGNHASNHDDHDAITTIIQDVLHTTPFDYHDTSAICPGDQVAHYQYLWDEAQTDLVRFVYDDDVIYPASTSYLVYLMSYNAQCVMAWHQRHWIDDRGQLLRAPSLIAQEEVIKSSRENILRLMAVHKNFIGEPSFVLFDKSQCAFTMDYTPLGAVTPRHYLGDVTHYLEATRHGCAVGGGAHLGAFRMHANQDSNQRNPRHALGIVDWEMIMRHEFVAGNINETTAIDWSNTIIKTYWREMERFPSLKTFYSRLSADAAFGRLKQLEGFMADYTALRVNHA